MILLIPTHPCHLQNLLDPAIDTIKRLLESSWISWIELTADGESRSAAISCNQLQSIEPISNGLVACQLCRITFRIGQ